VFRQIGLFTCCLHSWPSSVHSLGGNIKFKISSVSLRSSAVSKADFERDERSEVGAAPAAGDGFPSCGFRVERKDKDSN
jgi:hypothetical protein